MKKRYSYFIVVFISVIISFAVLGFYKLKWNPQTKEVSISAKTNTAYAIDLSECICCHGSTVERHHRLAENQIYQCSTCHQVTWDAQTQSYQPVVERNCLVCHPGGIDIVDRHHKLLTGDQAQCSTCHSVVWDPQTQSYFIDLLQQCNPTVQTSSVSHYSQHEVVPNNCTSCHTCNLFDQHGELCTRCHSSSLSQVQNAVLNQNSQCTACHSATVHSMKCTICHGPKQTYKSNQLVQIHNRHSNAVSCGVCHMIPETTKLETTGQYCKLCHGSAQSYTLDSLTVLHRNHVYRHRYFPYSCYECHGQAVPQKDPKLCMPCHNDKTYVSTELPSIHSLHNRMFECSNCHYDPRIFSVSPTVDCLRCHEQRPYTSVFQVHQLHTGRQCWSCHNSEDVSAKAGHTCVSCHGQAMAYSSTYDLHKKHDTLGFPCWACHAQIVPMYITTCQPISGGRIGTIKGIVTDSSGASLGDASILTTPKGYLTQTNSNGTYEICVISDVTYSVTAYKNGYSSDRKTITVATGQAVVANFMLTKTSGCTDNDTDGYTTCAGECDDNNAAIKPGATELCDGIDNNCNGSIDETFTNKGQSCSAGIGICAKTGTYVCSSDKSTTVCNAVAGTPATEGPFGNATCSDALDNDCDGTTDQGDVSCTAPCTDNDGDGYGNGCAAGPDCNDNNAAIKPGAAELCDGIDNDCDAGIDETFTNKGQSCSAGVGICAKTGTYICSSDKSTTVCNAVAGTPASEGPSGNATCSDGLDNDCDGKTDSADSDCTAAPCTDNDGDGYGTGCAAGPDCNDNNAAVRPGAKEICNDKVDNNCNGQIDCAENSCRKTSFCTSGN